MIISGKSEVDLTPENCSITSESENTLGRMSLVKKYHGALTAESRGEMLSVRTGVEGSAGYVAIEQVTGELNAKTGSFVLQHFGVMHEGYNRLLLEVVPDSATGDLKGLVGQMDISVEDGQHFYEFEYQFEK